MTEQSNRKVFVAKTLTSDRWSMNLAYIAMAGIAIWMIATYTRGGPIEGNNASGVLPTPAWWFTAAVAPLLALGWLGLQIVFLGDSAVTATQRETMGINDMLVSIAMTGFVAVTCVVVALLWWLGKMSISMNHVVGLGAWLFATGCETLATIRVWMVANRRPGGTIGGTVITG